MEEYKCDCAWIRNLIIENGKRMSDEDNAKYAEINKKFAKLKADWEKEWEDFDKWWLER